MLLSIQYLVLAIAVTCTSAKTLWSTSPATDYPNIIKEAYLLGNGRLGAMPFGPPGAEKIVLNVDSLWSGGPFSSRSYTGGNPSEEKHSYLPGIRQWIFQNTTGNVSQLLGNGDNYGSYQVMGNLSVSFNAGLMPGTYKRTLDLESGTHHTSFSNYAGDQYTTTVFCSYPDQVCVYQLNSTASLPEVSVKLENQLVDSILANTSCENGYVRLRGVTQTGPPEGLKYESIARLIGNKNASTTCNRAEPGVLIIPSVPGVRTIGIVVGAATNYDQRKGNAESNFSFRGDDPTAYVEKFTAIAASKSPSDLTRSHLEDYQSLFGAFSLDLPDPNESTKVETSTLFDQYTSSSGDPFIESLLFDYSRHLLISSSRDNSLPANLQGRWSSELSAAWSADYHANINIQMNYWHAEQTGLGGIQDSLWGYMQDTWVPRGTETAKLLYGAPGWVTHSEMNIYGHTGMKNDAQWANYPASAAWMMQHVTDHFSYSRDEVWLRNTGYPLLKGVAQFWLSQLQEDRYWTDGTLVVNPCNSPEHGPTTFACTHYQQLLHQVFASITVLGPLAAESDASFLANISSTLARLDKGLHFASWGGIKEWKLPEESSSVYDAQNNTHRHLSHFWGWYPGLTLISPSTPYLSGYTNRTIQDAIATSLYSRGIGTGPDANAGWAKVWRSACWARLNNTERAYFELKYAIEQNFVGNGLSMYSGKNMPFQIDANFGFGGAVLSMLVVDVQEPGMEKAGERRTVVLGPAIPKEWAGGRVGGLRVRGGGRVDFGWDEEGTVNWARAEAEGIRFVDRNGKEIPGR
ncbi:glycoside hydrolase family 95 protein [Zopfia rhizophila CBS 207.26]|uniref:Glycoside hydrolase family 95 protein n=1 Tax=Zopfia rhizophila CBS 207.26 TaxID=1314779 RepID=A0A6A6EPQ1_9PEZI|nr:glycoside hydrolase family 95 protein [Zopfia rhizophila CBS 207.26]